MSQSDMFFTVKGQKTGRITGSSTDGAYPQFIDVVDWSWGGTSPSGISGSPTGKLAVKTFKLFKHVDAASAALLQVMSTNEKIAEAELVVRKPGAAAQKPYVKITLKDARITAFDFESGVDAHGRPILNERVEFSFHGLEFVWTDGGRTANLDV